MVKHDSHRRNAGVLGQRDLKWCLDFLQPSAIPKTARQGQFDNLHLAPRLKLDADVLARKTGAKTFSGGDVYADTPTTKLMIDTIAMAPFCSHDCFHMHWRWSEATDSEWCLGWGHNTANAKPYTVAGAPLVPPGHDVDVTLLSATEVIYSESALGETMAAVIPALKWEIFCYAGAAYAQGISDWKTEVMNRFNMRTRNDLGYFSRTSPKLEYDLKHPPVFYWSMRYSSATEDGRPVEYLSLTDEELDQARKA